MLSFVVVIIIIIIVIIIIIIIIIIVTIYSIDTKSSRMFGSAPREIITYLGTQNVTYNHHRESVTPEVKMNILKTISHFFKKEPEA